MDNIVARALASLTTGIYVLTVAEGTTRHGMSSSWVTQVSGEPALFLVSVDNSHFSRAIVGRTGVFGFNVLGQRGKALEDYFYSSRARRPDNLEHLDYELSPKLQVPWLKLATVVIEAQVIQTVPAGDHTLLIAQIAGARINANERPLTSLDLDYVYLGGKEVVKRDRTGWD